MNLVATLQKLEPIFIQAGKLAVKMQKGVDHHYKYNTGNPFADIVTAADLAVQEFLLNEMVKTELVNCHLLAEENTPLAKKFNEQGKYYLGIDPIDGTATYAKGGKCYSTIISLHDGKNILYMFGYYPVFNWSYRVADSHFSTSGEIPSEILSPNLENSIVYWGGNPEENLPEKIYKQLKNKGIDFRKIIDIGDDVDSITMLALGKVAGTYNENPNVYDGITEFSIASAQKLQIFSGGPTGKFDLSNFQKRESGLYYPGWYLTLKN